MYDPLSSVLSLEIQYTLQQTSFKFLKILYQLFIIKEFAMNDFFSELSFPFVMDLYRIKMKAVGRGEKNAITSLKQHYPELFTDDFDGFIEKIKMAAGYLDKKYEQNFTSMFEPSLLDIDRILN